MFAMRTSKPRSRAAISTDGPEISARDYVQSLERGLAVIRSLGGSSGSSLAEVAKKTGLTRAAARRFLLTLESLAYVGRAGTRFFLLPKTLELGYSYLSAQSLPQIAQPHLQRLANELNESCSLLMLDVPRIVYIARVTVTRLVGANLSVGSTLPAYCTSAGRVLLAFRPEAEIGAFLRSAQLERLTPKTIVDPARLRREIERARDQGWYLIDEELEAGARALSAPVRDGSGKVVAAVNVSCYSGRVQLATMKRRFLPRVLATAQAIQNELSTQR